MDEGVVNVSGNTFTNEYHLKDHLGNVRVAFIPGRDSLSQVTDYYPFGMISSSTSYGSDNRYLYNGKELQTELDLGWYDYGARFYDPQIGRWHVVDPLAEKMKTVSTYAYGYNNPVVFIDEIGREPVAFIYYEIRGILPLIGELGITASFNGALYFEIGGDWEVGVGYTGSLGLSVGQGIFTGLGAGINWQANDINDLNGLGINIGAAIGIPGSYKQFGAEWNKAVINESNIKNGISISPPIKNAGVSVGYGAYAEASGTKIYKCGTITDAIGLIFNPMISNIDKAIKICETKGGFGAFATKTALIIYKSKVINEMEITSKKFSQLHAYMKSMYNDLNDEEKNSMQSGIPNNGWWSELYNLCLQVILNGGTVTYN